MRAPCHRRQKLQQTNPEAHPDSAIECPPLALQILEVVQSPPASVHGLVGKTQQIVLEAHPVALTPRPPSERHTPEGTHAPASLLHVTAGVTSCSSAGMRTEDVSVPVISCGSVTAQLARTASASGNRHFVMRFT